MEPKQAAERLREEIEEWLADWHGGELELRSVEPPSDLGANTSFTLIFANPRQRRTRLVSLASGLAIGYLADEEAAVDEWKQWLHSVLSDLG